MSSRIVKVFDTTLRDGEQAPNCSMSRADKLRVAQQLARLKVDVIEAGFPAASPDEWVSVNEIAKKVGTDTGPVICGLARAHQGDIEKCGKAIEPASHRRVHTFLATSDLHLEHKLRISRAQALESIVEAVSLAKIFTDDVQFSAEDASRSDPVFLLEALAAAVGAGATTLNIPDTVGFAAPSEYAALIARVIAEFGGQGIAVSTHCHDDLGLAVANTLAGIMVGATQVECTINGLGERAGNASLEEVVMALRTKPDLYPISTHINTTELVNASRLVEEATGVKVPCNKAIVGQNAFAHEAGIHQDGVLKNRLTYEIMAPEDVGAESQLVLGKHSGKNALANHLVRIMETSIERDMLERAFQEFKRLTEQKKTILDSDLIEIVRRSKEPPDPFEGVSPDSMKDSQAEGYKETYA